MTDAPGNPNSQIPGIGIGLMGYSFMGKAHTNAYHKLGYMMYPPPAYPTLVGICGLGMDEVREAAQRYGYKNAYTGYEAMFENKDIKLFDNCGPNNLHSPASIAAAEAGIHVVCEKPLARSAEEADRMLEAVVKANVKHMVAFNYRFVPAIRQAYDLIHSGKLGKIYHFRAQYLQEWLMPEYNTPYLWRMNKAEAGSGALGDLGAHIIDLAHFLVGDIHSVGALMRTFTEERPLPDGKGMGKVDVDDAFAALIEFESGAMGTLEATRMASGRKNYEFIEINAEKGSLFFNLERLNELGVYWNDEEPKETQGFHNVLVTEPFHPFVNQWWPAGHIIGWEHTFVHELTHFIHCIIDDTEIGPFGATFKDGYRAAVICDAIETSARTRKHVDIKY